MVSIFSIFINSAHNFSCLTTSPPPPIRRRKGFSFIEVMVVIMILGLLVGIVGVSLFVLLHKLRLMLPKHKFVAWRRLWMQITQWKVPQLIKNSVHYLIVQKSVLSQKIGMGLI